jgi:hypothetical protein
MAMNLRRKLLGVGCACAALIFAGASALADQWLRPTTKQDHSPNKQYSFEVVPQRDTSAHAKGLPKGTLFRVGADGQSHEQWTIRLVNKVAPVSALVSDGGEYVVTFDNWYGKGFGDDVVVIYGAGGQVIKKYALEELLSAEEVKRVPRSVSSRHWGGEHRLDEASMTLVLSIASGRMNRETGAPEFYERKIELATGNLIRE